MSKASKFIANTEYKKFTNAQNITKTKVFTIDLVLLVFNCYQITMIMISHSNITTGFVLKWYTDSNITNIIQWNGQWKIFLGIFRRNFSYVVFIICNIIQTVIILCYYINFNMHIIYIANINNN